MSAAMRCRVSGRVQGVSFRAATREVASALGLRGHARNLADGRVEVVCAGDAASLEAMAQWLRQGPPAARVEQLVREDYDQPVPPGFSIG